MQSGLSDSVATHIASHCASPLFLSRTQATTPPRHSLGVRKVARHRLEQKLDDDEPGKGVTDVEERPKEGGGKAGQVNQKVKQAARRKEREWEGRGAERGT